MATITIKKLQEDHFDDWLPLYRGYADHYQVALTESGVAQTWSWLMDQQHPVTGIVAEHQGQLIGLAHFRAMPSPLRGAEIGFLDDLFVDPAARGLKAGEVLLTALKAEAKSKGWPVVRWITRDNNYRARGLYDQIAVKTDWNTYEMSAD